MGYFGDFSDVDDVIEQFAIAPSDLDGVEILQAAYFTGSYEGDAAVVFRQNGQLFGVFAAHCSCYGLEGQWKPQEITLEGLRKELAFKVRYDCDWQAFAACFEDESS